MPNVPKGTEGDSKVDTGERTAGSPSPSRKVIRFWIVFVSLWMLAATWCVISMELRYRADKQNAIDPDEINWDHETPENYDV